MKEKVISSIVESYRAKKLSKALVQLKTAIETKLNKVLTPEEFADYVYTNEIEKNIQAVAGDMPLANAYAYFTDEALGGKTEDDEPFWLNVWDADTKLNYGGKPVELNELDQVTTWIPKFHPARVFACFDTQWQLNPVNSHVLN